VVNDRGFLGGTNTDLWGVFCAVGMFEAKDPVIVIGTGGAARTMLYHLHGINALNVQLFGRDRDKARGLLDRFALSGDAWSLDDEPQIPFPMMLINASPLGMAGQPALPPNLFGLLGQLRRGSEVFDMIYDPWETTLLAEARRRDLTAINGSGMLIDQARQAFELFFAKRPPVSLDDELCEKLTP
jgi:shikimate dehydrogenase